MTRNASSHQVTKPAVQAESLWLNARSLPGRWAPSLAFDPGDVVGAVKTFAHYCSLMELTPAPSVPLDQR